MSLSIPDLIISHDDYIAYPKILGERFSPEKFASFSDAQKAELIEQIGEFSTCLHNFRFSHQYLFAAPYGGTDFWNDLWLVAVGATKGTQTLVIHGLELAYLFED